MLKFAGNKSLDQIRAQCKAQGVRIDTFLYDDQGCDTIVVGGPIEEGNSPKSGHLLVANLNAYVIFNTFNGRFFGRTHRGVEFSSDSTEHDE